MTKEQLKEMFSKSDWNEVGPKTIPNSDEYPN